jgi:hypothetical protein
MSYCFEDRPHRGAQAFGRNRNKRVRIGIERQALIDRD